MIVFAVWYRPILYVAFDREYARSQNMPTRLIGYLMSALIAVTIVISIRVVGIVLLISLLTMPAVIANQLTRSFGRTVTLIIVKLLPLRDFMRKRDENGT